ncbi:LacI family DNA-binding transcriptional regulator [Streptosporangium sp. 'caverna']|uniref:LacI family DNA-binding transcriptional regulator n=1 Tax=Streptosporangium sp. 'caverna' TaxID=2202249 RepID=UPI000D7E13C5|nr:LacI family DNA-binding transcriptional regulator [Streptosporangium sp. 'caverna']AWS44229.1 LacI family transcriptional regulator [Streptosporangium sp. 'caverna']
MAQKVTITDVARHAKVSRQTVSNVLNTPGLVREDTRRRVLEAVETLGYRASQAARQMRTGRSRLIATRIEPTRDDIDGTVYDRFLHGLTEAAAEAGYRVLLYTADDDQSEIATIDDLLAAYEPDAFVLTGTHHGDMRTSWLAGRRLPFVTFGRPWGMPEGPSHPWVDVDGAAGTAAATRHLLDAGHRRIGFIGWPPGSGVGDDRRAGWARTLAAAGVDPAGLDRVSDGGVAAGEALARDLLDADRPATALLCVSDSLALGALHAARSPGAGGRANGGAGMPIAVIGFDDTSAARAMGLTSLSQPLAEAAACCVALLAHALDGAGVIGGANGKTNGRAFGEANGGAFDEARGGAGGGAHGPVATPAGTETSRSPGSTMTPTALMAPGGPPAQVLLQPSLVVRRSA